MTYCTYTDIRNLSPLAVADISNDDLTTLITYATTQVNSDINKLIKDEQVSYISSEKENDIDADNKIFYTKQFPIGDMTDSGSIDTSDIEAYTIDNDGTRTTYTVSSIDDDEIGKFTLASAPTTNEILYLTYMHARLEEETPHTLVKLATAQLTIAFANTKIDTDKFKSLKLGRLSTVKFESEYSKYMTLYDKTIDRINSELSDTIQGKAITW